MRSIRPEPWAAAAALLIALAIPALFMKLRADDLPPYGVIEFCRHESGETVEMSLEEYVAHLLAAYSELELSDETMKALACALRTSALLSGGAPCGSAHCDDPAHSPEYSENYGEREAMAVSETSGMVIVCKGALVPAAVHISSYLVTRSGFSISGVEIPCLMSVSTPEKITPELLSVDDDRMKMTIEVNFGVTFDPGTDLINVVTDNGGRAEKVEFAGCAVDGSAFASALGLASDCFTVERESGGYTVTVYGSGHGLGLSVMGAEALSREGYDHRQILAHYFTGSELVRAGSLQFGDLRRDPQSYRR